MSLDIPFGDDLDEALGLRRGALLRARSALKQCSAITRQSGRDIAAEHGFKFDSLERRYLLSADISPYTDVLDDGLDRLDTLVSDLEEFAEMAANIPVLDRSLGEIATLADTLRNDLIDPLQDYLNTAPSPDYDGVTGFLNGLTDVTVVGADGVQNEDELSWDAVFETTVSADDLLPNFGDEFAALGLDISAGIDFDVVIAFDFGFGVLRDPALSPADAFFIDSDTSLNVDGAADFAAILDQAVLEAGLLGGATITGASTLALTASADVVFDTATIEALDSKITAAELDATGLSGTVLTAEGSFQGDLTVNADGIITGLVGLTDAGITIQLNGDFFDAPTFSVTVDTPDLADFTRINSSTILGFVADLGAKLQSLSSVFQEIAQFDLFDVSLDKIMNFNEAVRDLNSALSVPGLVGTTPLDIPATGTATFELEIAIDGVPAAAGAVEVEIDFADVAGGTAIDALLTHKINTALAGSGILLEVEAFVEGGQIGIRAVVDETDTSVITDITLQNVSTAIVEALGLQEDQSGLRLPTFSTVQQFIEKLVAVPVFAGTDALLAYADGALTFNLDLSKSVSDMVGFSFDEGIDLEFGGVDFGDINFTGSANAMIQSTLDLAFGVGFDLEGIDFDTLLVDMNAGLGVGISATGGPDLVFQTMSGAMFDVSLAGVMNIEELFAAINEAEGNAGKVIIDFDLLRNGFEIEDTTSGDQRFTITGGADSQAIYDLGFGFGIAAEEGISDIFGASVLDRFFIDTVSLSDDITAPDIAVSVSMTATDINLFGSLGLMTFGVQNGQLGGTLTGDFFDDLIADRGEDDTLEALEFVLGLTLDDPNDDGRLFLTELGLTGLTEAPAFAPTGTGDDLKIEIELSDGSTYMVDFADVTDMEAAIAEIQSQTDDNVQALLNPAGGALILRDLTADDPMLDVAIADFVLTGQPQDGDTVTIEGTVFEFDDDESVASGNINIAIGTDATETIANLTGAVGTAFPDYSATPSTVEIDGTTYQTLELTYDVAPTEPTTDPTLRASINSAGSVWEVRTFAVRDLGDPTASDGADTAAEALGFAIETIDRNRDGELIGGTIAQGDFAALGDFDFVGGIQGELVLPIVFENLDVLGLDQDTVFLTVGFEQGSIASVLDVTNVETLLSALQNLGSQDLFSIIGSVFDVLTQDIDILNADLPLLGESISDLIAVVQNGISDIVEPFNDALVNGLEGLVDAFESAFDSVLEDLRAIDPDLAVAVFESFEGQTILRALEELNALVADLPQGFDLLFSDAPGKLLSAVAALRGAFARALDGTNTEFRDRIDGFGATIDDVLDIIRDGLQDEIDGIVDVTPTVDTVLRLLQEALGFDLPDLDDNLPSTIADAIGDELEALLGVADAANTSVRDLLEAVSDLISDPTGSVQTEALAALDALLEALEGEADTAVEAFTQKIQELRSKIANAAGELVGLVDLVDQTIEDLTGTLGLPITVTLTDGTELVFAPTLDFDAIEDAALDTAQALIDKINEQIAAAADFSGKIEAAIEDGKFVLRVLAEDVESAVVGAINPALEAALGLSEGAGAFLNTLQGLADKFNEIIADPTASIFALIQELPFLSDVVQDLNDIIRTLVDTSTDSLLDDLKTYVGTLADPTPLEDAIAAFEGEMRATLGKIVDDVRGAVLGLFGGGALQFNLDADTGLIDLGFYFAPTLFDIAPGEVSFDFTVGDENFGFGAEESGLELEIGGFLDVGFVLSLNKDVTPGSFDLDNGEAGGFGSDFEIYVDPESAIGLYAGLEVTGTLKLQIGAVGFKFNGAEGTFDENATVVELTDFSGEGPAFLKVGIDPGVTITTVAGRGLIGLNDLAFDVDAQAKLNGEVFAYGLSDTPNAITYLFDDDGDPTTDPIDKQVDLSFDLMVGFDDVTGAFDFEIDANGLSDDELTALFESLFKFDLTLILDAFELLLDSLGDLLDYLASAPVIGDGFAAIEDIYTVIEQGFDEIIAKLEMIEDDETVEAFVANAIFDVFDAIDTAPDDAIEIGLFDLSGELLTDSSQIVVSFSGGDTITDLDGDTNPALLIQPLRFGLKIDEETGFDFGLDAFVLEAEGNIGVDVALDLMVTLGFGLSLNEGAFLILPNEDGPDDDDDLPEEDRIDRVFQGNFSARVKDGTQETEPGSGVYEEESSLGFSLFFLGLEATPWVDDPTTENIDESRTFDDATGDAIGEGVGFNVDFALDLVDGEDEVAKTQAEIGGEMIEVVKFTDLDALTVEPTLEIELDIDLILTAGISAGGSVVDDNFPTLTTYLNIDWMWDINGGADSALGVQFYDLRLDMGEWMENTLGELLDGIQTFTAPLQPFLDFFDIEIPIVSQLSELFGQGAITILDAISFLGEGFETVQTFLEVLDTIDTVLDFIDSFAAGTFINFGDFIISENPGLDLRELASREILSGDGLFSPDNFEGLGITENAGARDDLSESSDGGFFDEIFDSLEEIGLSLPFLEEPEQLFGLLFGQRVDFIVWDIPRLEAEFGVSYKFGPILPPVPLFVTIGGGFEIFLDIVVGYDSRGLETNDFVDGFYFGDKEFIEGQGFVGEDVLELGLTVFFEATASLSVVVAEAGVTGGVEATIGANWNDINDDGKFYLDELQTRALQGIFCVFDLEGALEAFVEAFVKLGFDTPFGFVTIFQDAFELLRVTLLDFSVSCPPLPPPDLATNNGDGTVVLNIGDRADFRQAGANGDDDEKVEIFGERETDDGSDPISIWAAGFEASYFEDINSPDKLTKEEVTAAFASGHFNRALDLNEDDVIDADEIKAAFDLDGDSGALSEDFALVLGFGEWEIHRNVQTMSGDAGGGDDEVLADALSVKFDLAIDGGAGEDEILGGMGDDTLIGGSDADIVRGFAGNDDLAGDGIATIGARGLVNVNFFTGSGEDNVFGGAGGDLIVGGGANDTLQGDGEENDPATSDDGNDIIFGMDGEDQIQGFLGDDTLLGGAGADNIDGSLGDDIIRGDYFKTTWDRATGDDVLKTTMPNDSDGEIDLILGGDGGDFIRGDGGNDIIYGEDQSFDPGEEPITGLADTIHGDGGDDEIRGQFGDDLIYGGDDDDRLIGGEGADSIFGNAGTDEIYGDRLPADGLDPVSFDDYIEGGADNDRIFGQGGNDWIIGGISTLSGLLDVYAYDGEADNADVIRGGDGDDIILGDDGTINSGTDYFTDVTPGATGGDDIIYGGRDSDQIAGGQGADDIFGDPSGVAAPSESRDDILVGDEFIRSGSELTATTRASDGSDRLFGYDGADLAIGGGGSDSIIGALGEDLIVGDYAKVQLKSGGTLFEQIAWVLSIDVGSGAGDRLQGDAASDIIIGGDGGDQVFGGSLNDGSNILLGDHGLVVRDDGSAYENDIFSVEGNFGGNDTIFGGGQVDIVIGGTGDDDISSFSGEDVVFGDGGIVLRDSAANDDTDPDDVTKGVPDPTRVVSSFAGITVTGLTDVALGSFGGTIDIGLESNDVLATGKDDIDAGTDNDVALGGLDADLIYGRAGDDALLGDNGEVLYDGNGAGLTHIDVVRTLTLPTVAVGGIDAIFGEGGKDVALGGAGGDYLFGDLTAEPLRVGGDFDIATAMFASVNSPDSDVLAGDFGQLTLFDGGLPDTLMSTETELGGKDLIEGHEGNDIAIGGADSDAIHGEAAEMRYGDLSARDGDDVLLGDNGKVEWTENGTPLYERIQTIDGNTGATDFVLGNDGDDIIMGGADGDFLYGDRNANIDLTALTISDETAPAVTAGVDRILGDNGLIDFVITKDEVIGRFDIQDGLLGLDAGTILITTNDPTNGGADFILGDGKADIIFGGTDSDRIWGDEGNILGAAGTDDGNDLIFGDHGKVWQRPGVGDVPSVGDDYFAIDTSEADLGKSDVIFGEAGNDTILGQQGDDAIFGNDGDDNLIGGHNTAGGSDELDALQGAQISAIDPSVLADLDPTDLVEVNDIISGGDGQDLIAGDNAYIYQFGSQADPVAGVSLSAGPSERFQLLGTDATSGAELPLYSMTGSPITIGGLGSFDVDLGFDPNLGAVYAGQITSLQRNVFLLDFDANVETAALGSDERPFGDDLIAGGEDDDEIYGQLGDDIIQGDGDIGLVADESTVEAYDPAAADPSFIPVASNAIIAPEPLINPAKGAEPNDLYALRFTVDTALTDGDDYIEGNGGNDRIYGNLGQDDLIGGSSEIASIALNSDTSGAGLRPDGADLIYGGAGDGDWLDRNATYDETVPPDVLVNGANHHTADADVILGDNGNIYRLFDEDGDPRTFNYASGAGYGADTDDTTGLDDVLKIRVVEMLDYEYSIDDSNPLDLITSFNDFGVGAGDLIHGESGDDIVFGMTGDDVIFGEDGDDDIYGQAGADVLFGGRGVDGVLGDDGLLSTSRNGTAEPLIGLDTANMQDIIRTPGNLQIALIYRDGDLLKSIDLIAFDLDGVAFGASDISDPADPFEMTSANDIIFGGFENDYIHSGFGDDAISGAEALALYYGGGTDVNNLLQDMQDTGATPPAAADNPFWYAFAPYNPGDVLRFGATDPEEFALYDEDDPRSKILVSDDAGILVDVDFLLNNDATEGVEDLTFPGERIGPLNTFFTDGADHLFGDLGNDWIVGGTGRDHMFGGRGNDLLQMDDDLDRDGGSNTDPDSLQKYADIAYDGAGRDYLILNTGADRAIGWIGEFNSYIVPFSPFGAFQIARLLQPQTEQFVLDLADASGADSSAPDILRFAEQYEQDSKLDNPLDPAIFDDRRGSPFNELGMVRQEDFDWQDQSGPPDDPQAGNDKGKRNIMRREIWDPEEPGLQASLNQLEKNEWFLVEQAFNEAYGDQNRLELVGKLKLADGTEIFGALGDGETKFRSVEMSAIVSVDKVGKKESGTAFFVFDAVDDENFFYAGLDIGKGRVVIGAVVDGTWNVLSSTKEKFRSGSEYELTVRLSETGVVVLVNGREELSYDFAEDVTDGEFGVAATGVQATFKNVVIDGNAKVNILGLEAESDVTQQAALLSALTEEEDVLSVDWGAADVGSVGWEPMTTGSEEVTTSSDADSETEEEIVVEAWAPRDDFAA